MIKVISKQGALKALYFLMALDGVSEFEQERFEEIGSELLGDEFNNIKEALMSECHDVIEGITVDDERYDVIQEGIDGALNDTVASIEEGVVPRLLLWDMLSLAYSDLDYAEEENRLISHIVRILQIDKSVFAEMKHLIAVADSIQKEKAELENSSRMYSEIRPLIDEVEKRQRTIVEAAKALISDDIVLDVPEEDKDKSENIVIATGKKVGGYVVDGSKKLGESVTPIIKNMGEFASSSASGVADGAGKLFNKMKNLTKKKPALVLPANYEKLKEKLPEDMGIPGNATAYGMASEGTNALVLCFPVSEESSMDFDDTEGIIRSLHENMDEHAGIIEVKSGVSKNGSKYVYHIMKHSTDPESEIPMGNTYTINLNIQIENTIQFLNGSFQEIGTTGIRDNMVWGILRSQGLIDGFEGWSSDPYDPEFAEGFLMNLSEKEQYDEMFDTHPLSEIRKMVAYIIESN